jgi:hypothetical protein
VPTYYLLLTTYYLLPRTTAAPRPTTYYLLLTTYYSLLTTHYSLLTTKDYRGAASDYLLRVRLLTTYYLLLTTYYLLLTTYYLLLKVSALRADGLLLIATVLPFCARVYQGVVGRVGANRAPSRPLKLAPGLRCGAAKYKGTYLTGGAFERHLAGFVSATVGPLPLRLAAWTRVP